MAELGVLLRRLVLHFHPHKGIAQDFDDRFDVVDEEDQHTAAHLVLDLCKWVRVRRDRSAVPQDASRHIGSALLDLPAGVRRRHHRRIRLAT
jgi:hypothetical protein